LALESAGKRSAARMAITAITTNNSTSVKAGGFGGDHRALPLRGCLVKLLQPADFG
jgi:hypothetical protein